MMRWGGGIVVCLFAPLVDRCVERVDCDSRCVITSACWVNGRRVFPSWQWVVLPCHLVSGAIRDSLALPYLFSVSYGGCESGSALYGHDRAVVCERRACLRRSCHPITIAHPLVQSPTLTSNDSHGQGMSQSPGRLLQCSVLWRFAMRRARNIVMVIPPAVARL